MAGAEWYYARGGERIGPVGAAQLKAAYERGEVTDSDYVWTAGMANWAPAGQVRDQFIQSAVPEDPLAALGIPRVNFDMAGPATSVAPVVRSSYGDYAGFWRRFAAYFIDGILLAVVQFPINMVVGIAGAAMGSAETYEAQQQAGAAFAGLQLIGMLLNTVIFVAYFSAMEASKLQATVGKMALGIKVTDTDGDRISFGRALGRTFGKYVSIFTCFIGFIMAGFTERKQALHDMIASTLVVTK